MNCTVNKRVLLLFEYGERSAGS